VGLGLHDLVERERLVKVAFCFPGQGSQDVGMGQAMAGAFPEAQAVYDEAADAVGFDIASICFEGPIEELTRTEIQQPALVTTSLACLRAVETRGITADVVVGHSVGEYSALGAAGALSDRDAIALVRERGEATVAAAKEHPGAMAAVIGLEDSVVEKLCGSIGNVWPANYNCPGQLVVSGEPAAVDRLLEEATAHGARKTVTLRIGGAFHSPLVGSAGERLRPAVEAVSWQEPLPPFMSTVSAQIESADRLGELLVQQLTAPVRFSQAVATLVQEGVDTFVEIGPGQVLSGLVKRCDRSLRTISVGDPASLQKLEETLSAA
jgi:[acyl-carrier-protein] S-malonyltransferase